jgi:hypothetical protein
MKRGAGAEKHNNTTHTNPEPSCIPWAWKGTDTAAARALLGFLLISQPAPHPRQLAPAVYLETTSVAILPLLRTWWTVFLEQ